MAGKRYEDYVQSGKPWWKIILNILLSNVGMAFLCITFAVFGAFVFIAIELPSEENRYLTKLEKNKDVEDAINYLKTIFWLYLNSQNYNYTEEEFNIEVKIDLTTLRSFILDYNERFKYDTTDEWTYDWTFSKALLFTLTIMTTIGYGHIAPKTTAGRMFCIIYSLFGIPLLLVFMAKIGDAMGDGFRWAYSRLCCRWCRVRRRYSEYDSSPQNLKLQNPISDPQNPVSDSQNPTSRIRRDQVGKEIYMPTDMVNVPIMVCLFLIIVYLLIGAFAFSSWEDWTLGSSLYFCFISLTTIGFGDLVPLQSFLNAYKGFLPMMRMVFALAYIVLGIAMVSMCIQLMQEQIISKVQNLMSNCGMGNERGLEEEFVKVSKYEQLKQTPSDMTGNELDFNLKRRKNNQEYLNEEQDVKTEIYFEDEEANESDFSDF